MLTLLVLPVIIQDYFLYAGFSTRANIDSILDSVKVVVSMPQLMQLIPTVCLQEGCLLPLNAHQEYRGCGVLVHLTCIAGHRFSWSSSPEHLNHEMSAIHSNNLLLAASLLLSGNSFAKIQLMFKFMGLKMISRDMYYRWGLLAVSVCLCMFVYN